MNPTSTQIDRRRFMLYSSACALASSVVAPSAMAASSSDKAAQEPLAVGYWTVNRWSHLDRWNVRGKHRRYIKQPHDSGCGVGTVGFVLWSGSYKPGVLGGSERFRYE